MSELLNRPCGGRFGNIVESIGNTPLVELPRLSPKPDVRIYAKLEGRNPTGSVKDRVAKYLVEDLEARGLLKDDSIILEPTSGNTGIALAMIGRRKGYRVALVMPDNVTNERRQMAALFGAEVIDSPGAKGFWVTNGTPSWKKSSNSTPWKWTPVVSLRLFVNSTRTLSPCVTRIVGPGQDLL